MSKSEKRKDEAEGEVREISNMRTCLCWFLRQKKGSMSQARNAGRLQKLRMTPG